MLAEVDLSLSRSAVVLTVEGGMLSEDEDDDDDDEDEDSDESSMESRYVCMYMYA